jgi:hypothetical protein
MWAYILLFGIFLPILIVSAVAAAVATAIIMLRRRERPERIPFSGILFGYAGLMVLIGIFLLVAGAALGGKAAFAIVDKDFSYDRDRSGFSDFGTPESPKTDDEIEDDMREDVIYGVVLAFIGGVMIGPHAFGTMLLRRRRAAGERPVARGIGLIGLATSTIGFLAAGGTALALMLERFAEEDAEGWRNHHPGEPLALALLMAPLAVWFAYRIWAEYAYDESPAPANDALQAA